MGLTRPRLGQLQTNITEIDDPLIVLNNAETGANASDIGFVFERGTSTNVALIWDESADEIVFINTTETGSTDGNVTISSYANLKIGGFIADGLTYPSSDGTNGQSMVTDGNGNLSFSSAAGVVDWESDQGSTNIHSGNYTNTTYSVGDGGLTQQNFTTANNTKLDGIESSADVTDTANVVASLTAGTNVSISAGGSISSTDTNTTYSVGDSGLTQKNFTSTLKTKLDSIEASATADQTNAEIKTAYEANANSNEFSDAEQTKLSGVATSANNYSHPANHAISVITGLQTALDAKTTPGYVDTKVSDLVDSAPATLNTLNELALALGDDANHVTTMTTLIGGKLPLTGGTITGNLNLGDNVKAQFGAGNDLQIYHDGSKSIISEVGTGDLEVNVTNSLNVVGSGGNNIVMEVSCSSQPAAFLTLAGNQTTTSSCGLGANSSDELSLYSNSTETLKLHSTGIDVTGNVTATEFHGDGSNLTGLDADTLDGLDSTKFYREVSTSSGTVGPGWITVAHSESARHSGEVIVSDSESSDHAFIRIDWIRSYADSAFTVLNCGGHSNRIQRVRVLKETADNTYGWKKLQVYVSVSSNYKVQIMDIESTSGWSAHTVVTPVVQDTISGYSLHGNEVVDTANYNFSAEQGVYSGGNIKAEGSFIGTATSAQYADLAENYVSDSTYSIGTVLIFDGRQEVTESTSKADRRLAGIVSMKPAYLMNSELDAKHVVAIALQGRVPCRVTGVTHKGDLIISSDTPGVAMAWNEEKDPPAGSIIGKSLVSKNTEGEEMIEVAVGIR